MTSGPKLYREGVRTPEVITAYRQYRNHYERRKRARLAARKREIWRRARGDG